MAEHNGAAAAAETPSLLFFFILVGIAVCGVATSMTLSSFGFRGFAAGLPIIIGALPYCLVVGIEAIQRERDKPRQRQEAFASFAALYCATIERTLELDERVFELRMRLATLYVIGQMVVRL